MAENKHLILSNQSGILRQTLEPIFNYVSEDDEFSNNNEGLASPSVVAMQAKNKK